MERKVGQYETSGYFFILYVYVWGRWDRDYFVSWFITDKYIPICPLIYLLLSTILAKLPVVEHCTT